MKDQSSEAGRNLAGVSGKESAAADAVAGLAGRELDAVIAERVMGWRWVRSQPQAVKGVPVGKPVRQLWQNETLAAGLRLWDGLEDCYIDPLYMCVVPRYSADIAEAIKVEDRLIELSRTDPQILKRYSDELFEIVAEDNNNTVQDDFWIIHATADQRCRAARTVTVNAPEREVAVVSL